MTGQNRICCKFYFWEQRNKLLKRTLTLFIGERVAVTLQDLGVCPTMTSCAKNICTHWTLGAL